MTLSLHLEKPPKGAAIRYAQKPGFSSVKRSMGEGEYYLPQRLGHDEIERDTTKFEKPLLIGNTSKKLGNELFAMDFGGNVRYKLEVRMFWCLLLLANWEQ
jgi:hypothetical protein